MNLMLVYSSGRDANIELHTDLVRNERVPEESERILRLHRKGGDLFPKSSSDRRRASDVDESQEGYMAIVECCTMMVRGDTSIENKSTGPSENSLSVIGKS